MYSVDTLIVGAGISGLSFANFTERDDYLIVEANAEIGGYCRTVKQDGFVWDYSGHFFHFRHPEIEAFLRARMISADIRRIQRSSKILFKDTIIDFPFQKNIHQLPQDDFIDCLYDLYFREGGEPKNFEEMLYAKFGRGICERFLIPYNEKLYACDLAELDKDAMGRFFPYADIEDVIRNFKQADNRSYNATFTYPRGGAIEYINALAAGVNDGAIALEERLERLDIDNHIAYTNRRPIAYERLVSSAPFDRLLTMTNLTYNPATFTSNKVLVFNLGFDRKGPEDVHWVYFPERKYCFYRVGFYDNIFGSDRMSLYVEIGFPTAEAVDVAMWQRRVLTDLKSAGIVQDHQLVAHHSIVLDPAYVHITKQSIAETSRLMAELNAHDVYSIGRYGGWKYCSIEDNIIEARTLVETVEGHAVRLNSAESITD
ncbi:MAG: NAD(P)-binding protein [Anaerolineae bacterium]|nr:NAD(P)-binding protein [Anaerolineae bacterium]MCO5205661.1 NAD(P)-binding protein [Anaerolineae bacterium]